MFYLCSFYRRAAARVESLLAAALAALLLLSGPQAAAQTGMHDRWVTERAEAMRAARAHLQVLEDMAAGQVPHDVRAARAARRALIGFAKSIPKLFRRAKMDSVSRARPEIWADPKGFIARANAALRAARRLDTRSAAGLNRGLPGLVGACLACHARFRAPP